MLWWRLRQLKSSNPQRRQNAAKKLGRSKNPKAIRALISILQADTSGEVRQAAAKSLGQIGDSEAITPLMNAMRKDNSVRVRLICYSALEQTQAEVVSQADTRDLVEATAARIRSLHGQTRTETGRTIVGYEKEDITKREYVELNVGSPGHYGWEEVTRTVEVPKCRDYTRTIPDPDHKGIQEIIGLIPNGLYEQIRELSGEAKDLFE